MPTTVKAAPHGANDVLYWQSSTATVSGAKDHLERACNKESKQCLSILESSSSHERAHTYPEANGFVQSAIRAYSAHHHLIIRPEDVWFAIISQLSLYINKHAEELRHQFVAHKDKKVLKVNIQGANPGTVDYGLFARLMKTKIGENVLDPDLTDWVMPNFTTTTDKDRVIASILLMGSMQSYFQYVCAITCGIPSVMLLGEKKDWELLLARLDKLRTFGDEPRQWLSLLQPVLKRFVLSFDDPNGKEVASFWQRIAHVYDMGSGPTWYSGWITAFCFWDADGNSKYRIDKNGENVWDPSPDTWECADYPNLVLDGATYHRIDSDQVPPGYSSVPVLIDDDGNEVPAMMVAGSVGISCGSSGRQLEKGGTGLDTLQAVTDWWMFEKKSQKQIDEEVRSEKSEERKKDSGVG